MYERLTVRDEYGNADIIGVDSADLQLNLGFKELNIVTNTLNRLAEFEDIGLSPDEIKEKLSGTILNGTYIDINTHYKATAELDKLKDTYSALEERFKNALKEIINLDCESVEREKTLAKLEAEVMALNEAQRWRDAETEPPKCYGNYIVEFYTGVISSAWFLTGGSWQVESEHYKSGISGVIRWMPLPAAIEKGERREDD